MHKIYIDYSLKQLAKHKQGDLAIRMKNEQNLLFLKRAEDEISKEKKFKEHFINFNALQMKRNQAYLNAITGSHKTETAEEGGIKLIKVPNISKENSFKHVRNNYNINDKFHLDQVDNKFQNEKQENLEIENRSLERVKQSQYRMALENQLKEKKLGRILEGQSGSRHAEAGENRSTQYISMIPGINSTSPLILKAQEKATDPTLDEHRRKMK